MPILKSEREKRENVGGEGNTGRTERRTIRGIITTELTTR